MSNARRFGSEIHWSMTPSDMAVRTEGPMVHRVLQLVGSNVHGDEVVLECGARAPRDSATETEDPVDCMACMIRRTSQAMEAEWVENDSLDLHDVPDLVVLP